MCVVISATSSPPSHDSVEGGSETTCVRNHSAIPDKIPTWVRAALHGTVKQPVLALCQCTLAVAEAKAGALRIRGSFAASNMPFVNKPSKFI